VSALGGVVAIDGHDGAGKTTLARALVDRIGGVYRRPFHGALGAALLDAAERRDLDRLIAVGSDGITQATRDAGTPPLIVLDRGWMTVASHVDRKFCAAFTARWSLWMPTALCWADLTTTLGRLGTRTEPPEARESHRRYLAIYRALARRAEATIVRTDRHSERACLDALVEWCRPHLRATS
jgi:hypothetical protein